MIRNVLVLDHTGRVIVNRIYNEILSFERRLIEGFLSAMT